MMRKTSPTDLALPLIVVAALAYLVLRLSYSSLPLFQWYAAVPIATLAVVEAVIARRVRGAVRHDPDARPMTALAIARSVALGKASAMCGAGVVGACLALGATVLPDANRTTAASHDLRVALILLLASAMLTAGGLLLERAGVDPSQR